MDRERKPIYTTPEGKKVFGSTGPPPDIAEKLREQRERNLQFSKQFGDNKQGEGEKRERNERKDFKKVA